MIPSTIHTIWMGGDMPHLVRRCVKSQGAYHPDWTHIIWDEKLFDAIGYDYEVMRIQLGSWAAVTNWFRLRLLQQFGGIYLDADVECIRNLGPLLRHDAFAAMQDAEGRICNAVMGARAGHPWISRQISQWNEFDQRDPASGVYLATAVDRDDLTVIPTEICYPFLFDAPEEDRKRHHDSLMIHHWLKSWGKQ